ncbi:MAG: Type II secretion system protein G precursor [bacterium ADurb.Bin374]|nr:MAG: Type II secretion system protein G precursor [bacterium ADurb.Bin374]
MIRRHGFTLIELLIVVTIIAILAGAAVPYVQDYVEQARVGRAKADLDEIKRAIMLYEVQYGPYTGGTIASLVGPFLTRNIPDPWGNAYTVSDSKSTVFSSGPDGVNGDTAKDADNISVEFRPRMAVTRVTFNDADGDGFVSSGDSFYLKTCRPVSTPAVTATGLKFKNNGVEITPIGSPEFVGNIIKFPISGAISTTYSINKSTLEIGADNTIKDLNETSARTDVLKVLLD